MTPRFLMSSVAAAAALLSTSCTPDGTTTSAPRSPQLVFTDTTHTFGRVEAGQQLTHTYTFHNAGGLDLSIDNVRAACACTAAAPATHVIPPNGDGTISVTFDTTHEFGHQAHTVTVYSNDPLQPVATLTVVADIDAPVAADPPELYVGHLHRSQQALSSVRLTTTGATAIGAIETTGRVLDANLSTAPGASRQLRVVVRRDAPLGRFKESVQVHTTSIQQPPLTIPVIGTVDADDVAAPGSEKR